MKKLRIHLNQNPNTEEILAETALQTFLGYSLSSVLSPNSKVFSRINLKQFQLYILSLFHLNILR